MQTKCFYNRTAVFWKLINCTFINISGKKHSFFFQLFTFRNRSSDLLRAESVFQPFHDFFCWQLVLHAWQDLIGYKVYQVNTSTVNVKNNIISIALVSVNQTHFFEILSCKLYLKNPGQISSVLNSLQKSGELFLQVPCPLIFSGTVHSAS